MGQRAGYSRLGTYGNITGSGISNLRPRTELGTNVNAGEADVAYTASGHYTVQVNCRLTVIHSAQKATEELQLSTYLRLSQAQSC